MRPTGLDSAFNTKIIEFVRRCRRFPCLALLLVLDSIYLHRPWVVYKGFSSQICWDGARWSYRKWRDRKWPPVTCHVTPKSVEGCAHEQSEVGVLPPFFPVFWPEMTLPVVGFPRLRECATESWGFPPFFRVFFFFPFFFSFFFFFYLFFYSFISVHFFSLFFIFFFFEYRKMKSFYNVTQVTLDFKCCSLKKYGKKDAVFS